VSHYSWTKESRTLDKKLNGKKKTSEIKKKVLYGKEMSSDSQKLKKKKKKKKNFLKGNNFCFFFLILKTYYSFQYPKYQLGFFWMSRISCTFKFDMSIFH